jgi:hypothetical protein
VKIQLREYQRRSILPLAGVALAAYYLMVFAPIKNRATGLDAPLEKAWHRLAASLEQTNVIAIDFLHITNQLVETRQELALLDGAKQKAIARLELAAPMRARMNGSFELVDYENERSKAMDDLSRLAKQQQVTIEPAVLAGFPEHTADMRQPGMLWAALALADGLLRSAIQCKIATIHTLEMPLILTNAPLANNSESLAEIALQVEFTGPAGNVSRLLQSLPLRGDEIRAAGLAESPLDKPALFIDRLLLKKQSPEKPDEVRVALRVIGFVLRE